MRQKLTVILSMLIVFAGAGAAVLFFHPHQALAANPCPSTSQDGFPETQVDVNSQCVPSGYFFASSETLQGTFSNYPLKLTAYFYLDGQEIDHHSVTTQPHSPNYYTARTDVHRVPVGHCATQEYTVQALSGPEKGHINNSGGKPVCIQCKASQLIAHPAAFTTEAVDVRDTRVLANGQCNPTGVFSAFGVMNFLPHSISGTLTTYFWLDNQVIDHRSVGASDAHGTELSSTTSGHLVPSGHCAHAEVIWKPNLNSNVPAFTRTNPQYCRP